MANQVRVWCGVYGEGTVFSVKIAVDATVEELQETIVNGKREVNDHFKVDPSTLKLYLAKKDGKWLESDSNHIPFLKRGRQDNNEYAQMTPNWQLDDETYFGPKPDLGSKVIHVLVELPEAAAAVPPPLAVPTPSVMSVVIHEDAGLDLQKELAYYQRRGHFIQDYCKGYCEQILDKIDEIYSEKLKPMPFVCVAGSSGMGKSQLAFALEGRRPWFYWLATTVGDTTQDLYSNFRSISMGFEKAVNKDVPDIRKNEELNTHGELYLDRELWTCGFLRALLEHSCRDEYQKAKQMIRFDTEVTFNITPCNVRSILEVVKKMRDEGNALPFFILDEVSLYIEANVNISAFQRNVIRACGLVVIIMGTDSKITNLVSQARWSFSTRHKWMSLVPRFPPYQLIPSMEEEEETTWSNLVQQYPVIQDIVTCSRGRFARYFVEEAVKYATRHSDITLTLPGLLDEVCGGVNLRTQVGKMFLSSEEGRYAQLMAISFTNATNSNQADRHGREPPKKKKKPCLEVGSFGMHLHFANLIDDGLTDIEVSKALFRPNNGPEWKPKCCFPAMDKDVLLYLSILGCTDYPSYFDQPASMNFSTKQVFAEARLRTYPVHGNLNAKKLDYEVYENMAAHAIFCASRRNGVVGIGFDEFFACLLGEFQDDKWKKMTLLDENSESIDASALFEGYDAKAYVSTLIIPFLSPPNAEWPAFIVNTNDNGCNFGHLVRNPNKHRCDVSVRVPGADDDEMILIGECKNREANVSVDVMKGIIDGLLEIWDWGFALVFCRKLASFQKWHHHDVGCVKVCCEGGGVTWMFQPKKRNRKRLVIVIETGDDSLPTPPADSNL